MYLIYDTETTGFFNLKLEPTHKNQARVIQIAAILYDDKLNEVESYSSYVKPAGWTIHPGAQAAHGITLEQCEAEGKKAEEVFAEFFKLALKAHTIVCHNAAFDEIMLGIEVANLFMLTQLPEEILKWMDKHQTLCTMNITTDILKLPFAGRKTFGQKYKWPKLQEAHEYFFNETFSDAHDALADVRATARVFKHLIENKLVKI